MSSAVDELMILTKLAIDKERATEVAGLGLLSAPAIAVLRRRPGRLAKALRTEKGIAIAELAGLGTLAAPSVAAMIRRRRKQK